MDRKTFKEQFVKKFIEDFYDEEIGSLESCTKTAEMIADDEYFVEYGYEEYENGLH